LPDWLSSVHLPLAAQLIGMSLTIPPAGTLNEIAFTSLQFELGDIGLHHAR